jgi:hypothetical protein
VHFWIEEAEYEFREVPANSSKGRWTPSATWKDFRSEFALFFCVRRVLNALFACFSRSAQMAAYDHAQNGVHDYHTNGSATPTPAIPTVVRKKLTGYVGFANLPNQVHRRSVRKGFHFTAMVVGKHPRPRFSPVPVAKPPFRSTGESGLGKSTLINTLFNTTLYPRKEPLPPSAERPKTVAIESISAGAAFFSL